MQVLAEGKELWVEERLAGRLAHLGEGIERWATDCVFFQLVKRSLAIFPKCQPLKFWQPHTRSERTWAFLLATGHGY